MDILTKKLEKNTEKLERNKEYFFAAEMLTPEILLVEHGRFLADIPKLDFTLSISEQNRSLMDAYIVFVVNEGAETRKVSALSRESCFSTLEELYKWWNAKKLPSSKLVFGRSCVMKGE